MPKESETYLQMTSDDVQARRLASLIVGFSNVKGALSSDQVHNSYYPELNDDSFRRTFQRDRERLTLCGFLVSQAGERDGQKLWAVDGAGTFADVTALSDADALLIDVACAPLVDDPDFPYREELRLALAKIDRSFAASTVVRVGENAASNALLGTLVRALSEKRLVKATYRSGKGIASERTLALFGSFGLRNNTYFVAARPEDEGAEPHVYRLGRFEKVALLARGYQVHDDFCIDDYVRLPFQLGDALYEAAFRAPSDAARGVLRHGVIDDEGLWHASVSDQKLAAAWAIGEGFVPVAPKELADTYETILGEAARNGC